MTTIRVLRLATGQVEEVEIHEYAKGVVPCEVFKATPMGYGPSVALTAASRYYVLATWPWAALEAQGLAAISYAVFAKAHPRHSNADVCDGTHCQVYDPDARHPRTDEAVENVRDMYVFYPPWGEAAVETVYSASCGGHTVPNEDVWPGDPIPYLRGVPCPCGRDKYGHGVGMCQWGAYEMASAGADARQIIQHYYTGCEVRNWPTEEPPWFCDYLCELWEIVTEFAQRLCGGCG